MGLLERIANTSMTRRKDPFSASIAIRRIKLNIHKFVHIAHYQHVTIQLYHSIIFFQRERSQFAPAVVKSWVVRKILFDGWQEVFDSFLGNSADIERAVSFFWECVGVEGYEGVLGPVLLEGEVKGKETGEIGRVCYKGCPYFWQSAAHARAPFDWQHTFLRIHDSSGIRVGRLRHPCSRSRDGRRSEFHRGADENGRNLREEGVRISCLLAKPNV